MSTNCECIANIPDFCSFSDTSPADNSLDKEKSIEAYTNCIEEAKKCLRFTENPISREKLCKQIAIGYNERGFVRYRKVDFEDAISDYTKALSYDSSLYFTHYNRGLIHYRLGRFEEAIYDMKEALSLKPDFKPAQQCLHQAETDKQNSQSSQQ
ncbi:tetratricopeptide repeat protein 32-like [Dreissena polymorpha]|uniref:Tetratricopeptide repeat protein 32 n=1 Tax=Dreissena polymorpha TaxID=45954 RepID=A0A9D4IAL9_DREPO|nr:tetratricopeptide repeat protein 32-like [Dreissena polymorpha]KAH3752997.1 hypothetical protein DPMN_187625 [Dreissena polymorpha]